MAPTAVSEGTQTEEFEYLFERPWGYKAPEEISSILMKKCGFTRGGRPSKC